MLSRSNSTAGERLRRAKSTSSTHTSSSGHQRTHASIDPFVTRQQAEVAAVEAYERARQHEPPTCPAYRPVPPKLQRKHSQVTGRPEGSHLEDARLGRRKSGSRKENVGKVKTIQAQPFSQKIIVDESNGDEISIRRRYVVPPNPSNRVSQYDCTSLPALSRYPQRSESGYGDGSPLPRNGSVLKERGSKLQLRTGHTEHSDGYSGSVAQLSDFNHTGNLTSQPLPSLQETQTNRDILAIARDKCLQDFHHHKLRERKSFLLAPFQKRRTANLPNTGASNFDTKLPPFNYADERIPPPPPTPPVIPAPSIPIRPQSRTCTFSDTLKGRFRKVFRRTSRVPSGLPVQHIEAKDFSFSTYTPLPTPEIGGKDDPFTTFSSESNAADQDIRTASASSRRSASQHSTGKSRVTSWTTSTVAGTWSTRNETGLDDLAEEHNQLKRSDSVSTLRKASSFLGRSFKSRLQRSSKAELRSSDESTAGLYSALRERIKSPGLGNQSTDSEEGALSTTTSALATLPSQQKATSTISSKNRWPAPTIRSVTPEPTLWKSEILSPVTEVFSPDANNASHKQHQDEHTPRTNLQRRPAMKAPTPSQEQITRRIERSKNRWQSPLDELSPQPPLRATRAGIGEDNPYELRSLSRALHQHQDVRSGDLPHHAKVGDRDDVMSPSVYSRATDDGATPVLADTRGERKGDMMVTITGREVRRYSVSPSKRSKGEECEERPVLGSADWRRWLDCEMDGFGNDETPERFALPKEILSSVEPVEMDDGALKNQGGVWRNENEGDSARTAPEASGTSTVDNNVQHSHVVDKGSSYRNDRYPMITARRPTTRSSFRKDSRGSPWAELGPELTSTGAENTKPRSDFKRHDLSRSKSVANFASVSNGHSRLDAQGVDQGAYGAGAASTVFPTSTTATAPDPPRHTSKAYKPKSAFDLRANYKTGTSEKAKPIAVRRKSTRNNDHNNIYILEDTTIQNISAGPYASQQPFIATSTTPDANKENSPPPSAEANSLPVLSSSEWLAAGTKRDGKTITSGMQPDRRSGSRSVSRHSPARTIVPSGGSSSPGQRLVTNWLDGTRGEEKGGSPVFV